MTSRCGRLGAARLRQFDAPVSAGAWPMIASSIPARSVTSDLGALCYGIVLAAWDRPRQRHQRAGHHPVGYRARGADIPEDQVIMTCVAMGYPMTAFPPTASLRSLGDGDFVRYVGFND